MSILQDKYTGVFEALLNPASLEEKERIPGSVSYKHIVDNPKDPLLKLHNFILSEEFIAYQEEKLKLLLGIFIFRNPFDLKGGPFYLLGNRDAFQHTQEKPSFILQPHYYELEDNQQKYKPEPLEFIDKFLKVNLDDRSRFPATSQDFFIHINDPARLSRFERENELYYVPSGEFDFCLLQWLVLLIRRSNEGSPVNLTTRYDIRSLLIEECPKELEVDSFFKEQPVTLGIWMDRFGITDNGNLTERGEAMFYWLQKLLTKDTEDSLFTVNADFKKAYLLIKPNHKVDDIEGLFSMLNKYESSGTSFDELLEDFVRDCRFRLPVHFIMRYSKRDGKVETACRGLFAFTAFKQRLLDDNSYSKKARLYENVGYFLGLFRDATAEGRNYATMGECPEAHSEFKSLLSNYKLMVKILGEIEFREIYNQNVLQKQFHDLSNEARQSAIASVLARSLSHYHGSHILPDIRNYFKKLKTFDDSGRGYIVTFLDFLQNRMELIADITLSESSRSAFAFVLETDLLKPFQEYLHGAGLGLFDAFHTKEQSGVAIKVFYQSNKNPVLIPGGQLGISALYLIMENILRNYYKHANKVASRRYKFNLEITEPEQEALRKSYWCIDFCDLHGGINELRRADIDGSGEFSLIQQLQSYIDQPVIDHTGRLRTTGLGFIEMKAAACFLINYPLINLDSDPGSKQFPAKLLEVAYYNVDAQSKKMKRILSPEEASDEMQYNLGFRFYLKKVKNLLIDTNVFNKNPEIRNPKGGISRRFYGYDQRDDIPLERTDHEILVTNKKLPATNQRVVRTLLDQNMEYGALMEHCWKLYTDQLSPKPLKVFFQLPVKTTLSGNQVNVVVDDHGRSFANSGMEDIKSAGYDAYFVQSSDMPTFPQTVLTCSSFEGENKCLLPFRVKETALIKVSIFDERIQNNSGKVWKNQPNLTLRDIHELGGIYIPVKPHWRKMKYEMDAIDLDQIDARYKDRFRDLFESRMIKDDYVIIHYSLFEKIIPEKINIRDYMKMLTETYPNKLVFCSGSVRKDLKIKNHLFINLSTLQRVLINRPSKYELVNTLKLL